MRGREGIRANMGAWVGVSMQALLFCPLQPLQVTTWIDLQRAYSKYPDFYVT